MSLLKSTLGIAVLGVVSLAAPTASALSLNATDVGSKCAPPTSDCAIIVVETSSQRGQKAYSNSLIIESSTEEELLRRYQAEFIVATDLQDEASFSSVRGQSIGF